jgi:hypothetical protein
VELTEESPTEHHLTRRTFANNLAIYINHFAGRDGPNGRRGSHLAGGPARRDGGRVLPELFQDEADLPRTRVES